MGIFLKILTTVSFSYCLFYFGVVATDENPWGLIAAIFFTIIFCIAQIL
jgi:hypothetical protein